MNKRGRPIFGTDPKKRAVYCKTVSPCLTSTACFRNWLGLSVPSRACSRRTAGFFVPRKWVAVTAARISVLIRCVPVLVLASCVAALFSPAAKKKMSGSKPNRRGQGQVKNLIKKTVFICCWQVAVKLSHRNRSCAVCSMR